MIIRSDITVMGEKWTIVNMVKDIPLPLITINSSSQILDIFVVQNKALAGATLEFNLHNYMDDNHVLKTYYKPQSLAALPTKKTRVAYDDAIKANETLHGFNVKDVITNISKRLNKPVNSLYNEFTLSTTLKGVDATGATITIYIRRI